MSSALIDSQSKGQAVVEYGKLYGPYAFGVASLLLIWFSIVKPELQRSAIDLKAVQAITTELSQVTMTSNNTAQQQQATAEAMKTTAVILSDIVKELKDK